MPEQDSKLLAIPTNIITGFLGAGKTSSILQLLEQRPGDERWAVLVNEFGEVGVDGSLIREHCDNQGGVYVREVPGGCMCCAAGLPMQIALSQLLRRAKPHRLLIEPTGLGHPTEVLQTLSAEHYRDVLSIQKVLTLVDARKLSDKRYTEHATFRQQVLIADVVIANKEDLYQPADREAMAEYLKQNCSLDVELVYSKHGAIALEQLQGATLSRVDPRLAYAQETGPVLVSDLPFPDCGYVSATTSGEGFESMGWRFSPDKVFDRNRLLSFLSWFEVERMKAVFITHEGMVGYNMTDDALTEMILDDCLESRIEIIASQLDQGWEEELLACIDGEPD